MRRPILTFAFMAISLTVSHAKDRPMLEIVWPQPGADIELGSSPEKAIGVVMKSKSIIGPYEPQGPSIYPAVQGLTRVNLEDPVVWHSGGLYHIVVNSWSARKAYHITSKDGVAGWKLRGLAYDPTTDFLRYTDGTVNRWDKIERPAVFLQNGHVTHFSLSVIDVPKEQERGNDGHGSKIIVVPFDGEALDRDLAKIVAAEGAGQ